MSTTAEKITVMQAYIDGKPIKVNGMRWLPPCEPHWNWEDCDYSIAVTKPSINSDHVADRFKWMATDDVMNSFMEEIGKFVLLWIILGFFIMTCVIVVGG